MADIEEYSNDDDFGYSREYNSDDASYNEDYNDGFGDFDKGLHNHDNIDYDRYLNKRKPFFNLDDYVLNIPTKINKGTVEIITPVELIKKGDQNVLALSVATEYNLPQAEKSRNISRGSKQASLLLPQPPVAAAAKQEEKKPQLVDIEVTFAQLKSTHLRQLG
ncbi:unnamed protein product [Malus baccata var. baccata]